MPPPMGRVRQRFDVDVMRHAAAESDLHPVNVGEEWAVKGAAPRKRDDVTHMNPELIQIAPHAVSSVNRCHAGRLSKIQV